ncbi:hypothetical protein IGS59_05145 [Janthinobacterium sp. GW460P]|uniref:hypothetical protein n=1 Tax=unclassified Janthinobacterium TaxID=2610881 RepID=UPI00111C7A92|nr:MULTISPECIES: hypothetical protein [unclassified Janthinobacterium]MCC7701619.1 hypothetical protein [Janthinobacterium sp. GW460P]MCC7707126.1 hypothetical protein [Janthinobacterium sp. GW460W]
MIKNTSIKNTVSNSENMDNLDVKNILKILKQKETENKLTKEQIEILKKIGNSKKDKEIVWSLLFEIDPIEKILNIAKQKMQEIYTFEGNQIISNELRHAIAYALLKSNNENFKKIIHKLTSSKSNVLKLIASEYYLYKKNNHKAIEILLKILEDEEIDHNISDAIDMHISSCTNSETLSFIEKKIKSNIGNKKTQEILNYVLSIMKISMK